MAFTPPKARAQRIGRRKTKFMVGQKPEGRRVKLLHMHTRLVRKTLADLAGSRKTLVDLAGLERRNQRGGNPGPGASPGPGGRNAIA